MNMDIKEGNQAQEKLPQNDNERFVLELDKISDELEKHIKSSAVEDSVKGKCREIIADLKKESEKQVKKIKNPDGFPVKTPHVLARDGIVNLMNNLDSENKEQFRLFEVLIDTINEARGSAIDFKNYL